MTRARIKKKIEANTEKIKKLLAENTELTRQGYLLSDKEQQFTETVEVHGRGKNKQDYLVGRIHWKEVFIDEGDGSAITIERSRPVRIDGVWQ